MLILSSDLNISDIVVTPLNPNFVNNPKYLVNNKEWQQPMIFYVCLFFLRVVSKHRKAKN